MSENPDWSSENGLAEEDLFYSLCSASSDLKSSQVSAQPYNQELLASSTSTFHSKDDENNNIASKREIFQAPSSILKQANANSVIGSKKIFDSSQYRYRGKQWTPQCNNFLLKYRNGSRSTPLTTTKSMTTSVGSSTPYPLKNQCSVILALVEGRGVARGEIGMASIDLKNPELQLSQFADNASYAKVLMKLSILDPVEIIMPNTICGKNGSMSALYSQIVSQMPDVNFIPAQRKYFNEIDGINRIKELCVPEYNTVIMEVKSKYYSLATGAALLKYLESVKNIAYASASLKISFVGLENTTVIDALTVKNLELISNLKNPKSQECLYGVLNYTKTLGGARLLRANILQPPCDEDTINTRLDCISELVSDQELFFSVQGSLSKFLEVGSILNFLIQVPKTDSIRQAEQKITNILQLKHIIEMTFQLKASLHRAQHPIFKACYKVLNDNRFSAIMELIAEVVHEDSHYQKGTLNMKTQKCFAIKPNINGLLDIARRTYSENVNDVAELIGQLAEKHNLPCKTTYSTTRGFHIQVCSSGKRKCMDEESLPKSFIKVQKNRNSITFMTEDLIKLNDRISQALTEIYCMSNSIISKLMTDLLAFIGCLYELSETICTLDLLVSLAHACSVSNYVRPLFGDIIDIREGLNPIIDRNMTGGVANDTYASDYSNITIITGPNMSGKSTYLKQVALLQIMAQVGSFVPAKFAFLKIVDHVFSRIANADDMENNSSTFTTEMVETNYILQNLTPESLVIIDELGRGTNVEEGVGICWAILEYFVARKAFIFFATHFLQLQRLQMYPNVNIQHMVIQEEEHCESENIPAIIYTYQLSSGCTKEKNYGLKLAELSNFPKEVLEDARNIAIQIGNSRPAGNTDSPRNEKEETVFQLANEILKYIRRNSQDNPGASSVNHLKELKTKYLSLI